MKDQVFLEYGLGIVFYQFKYDGYRTREEQTVLRVPLSLGYTLSSFNQWVHLHLFTGPRVSYIVAGKIVDDGEKIKYKDLDEEPDRFFVDWNFGVELNIKGVVGLGVEYGLDTGDKRFDYLGFSLRFGF